MIDKALILMQKKRDFEKLESGGRQFLRFQRAQCDLEALNFTIFPCITTSSILVLHYDWQE